MELIYIWAEKYRTYTDTEINLSNKFKVHYDKDKQNISIEKTEDYKSIYPEHITNISAFVGKNAAGKSNLLDLIGMRVRDRNKQKEEVNVLIKNNHRRKLGYTSEDIERIDRKFLYFMIYFLGKDENGKDLFCLEGNYIDQFLDVFKNKEIIDQKDSQYNYKNYWLEKNWFPLLCTYDAQNKKFIYITDTQKHEMKLQHKLVCISFRDNFNKSYYDTSSFENEDETKIAIPRRVSYFISEYAHKKAEFLYNQIKKDTSMYTDQNYYLTIECNKEKIKELEIVDDEKLDDFLLKKCLNKKQCDVLKILYRYILRLINSTTERDTNEYFSIIENLNSIEFDYNNEKSFYNKLKLYYRKCVNEIKFKIFQTRNYRFNEMPNDVKENMLKDNLEDANNLVNTYNKFNDLLEEDECYFELNEGTINFKINKQCDIKKISNFLKNTLDERYSDLYRDKFDPFIYFFEVIWKYFSDGELAYLGFYTALEEQISLDTKGKTDYILLLDEPEVRMHPELCRNFINDLINFLSQYKDKKFQIIISSHSPFIISDIPKYNVTTIKKENGISVAKPCEINTFGQNIHTLLKSSFFMDYTLGEFSRRQIENVKKYLEEKCKNPDYISDEMSMDKAEQIISLIGEPLIKSSLENKFMQVNKDENITDGLKEAINKYHDLNQQEKEMLIKHIIKEEQ